VGLHPEECAARQRWAARCRSPVLEDEAAAPAFSSSSYSYSSCLSSYWDPDLEDEPAAPASSFYWALPVAQPLTAVVVGRRGQHDLVIRVTNYITVACSARMRGVLVAEV
jgi:hypothetical protein